MDLFIQLIYLVATLLFILGLKAMSSPVTARGGIVWAGIGMVLATLISLAWPNLHNYALITLALALGSLAAWVSGKRVKMTDMPQMIALYNGMGGGAAGAIAAVSLLQHSAALGSGGTPLGVAVLGLALLGAIIGTVSFSGSLIAFAKLQGILRKAIIFRHQQRVNLGLFALTLVIAVVLWQGQAPLALIALFFGLALLVGVAMTLPIGGADMPVVISLYNAFTGLAVAFEGFVLNNAAMIIAGTVVGAAGSLLTQLMAKAMNRPITNVLFSAFGQEDSGTSSEVTGSLKPIDVTDAAIMMGYASTVTIVPGYGLAVAQAQHKIWELAQRLQERGVMVKFAIHPVAGRMPGHMNVLLAEAGVPYDLIFDLEEINADFPRTDVALIIGANDVVNPIARIDPASPIYGMPILDADKARNVLVIKRGQGKGFSGVENLLFYQDNTRMVYGDGQQVAGQLIQALKQF